MTHTAMPATCPALASPRSSLNPFAFLHAGLSSASLGATHPTESTRGVLQPADDAFGSWIRGKGSGNHAGAHLGLPSLRCASVRAGAGGAFHGRYSGARRSD